MEVLYVIVALVTGFSLLDYLTARKWQQVTSNTRNEVVFAHRNKEYGAYVLRSSYNKRMVLIMVGMVLFAGISYGVSELIKRLPKEEVILPKDNGENLTLIQQKEDVPPPVTPPPPPPPKLEQMTAFLPPVVEDDPVDDPVPTQNQMENERAGAQNQDGTDEGFEMAVDEPTGGPALTEQAPDPIETWVEVEAEFQGGFEKLNEFINDNFHAPAEAADLGVTGRVIVRFVVEKDGTISNPVVEQKLDECPACDKEALRVVSRMPKWKPASNAGREVRTYVRLPIKVSPG